MKILQKLLISIKMMTGIFFIILSILAFSAPVIQTSFGVPSGENIYSGLSPICHQYPTRSLWILNRPFALCSRCFSGYLGLGIGLIFINPRKNYLKRLTTGLFLMLPGVVDGLLQLMTLYESTNMVRTITGFMGGFGIFYIIYPFNFLTKRGNVK